MVDTESELIRTKGGKSCLVLTAFLTLLVVALMVVAFAYRDELEQTKDSLRGVRFRARALEEDMARLREVVRSFESPSLQVSPTLTKKEIAEFRRKGLTDPYNDIVADLVRNPKLVSTEGSQGGDMMFLDPDDVCVLGPDRVLAYFEDAHNGGRALLSYGVSVNGEITWRVVESYSND